MDTNPTPPRYGYRSYAELIKQLLVYGNFYVGWTKKQGRFSFSVMYAPAPEGTRYWDRTPIGYEMAKLGVQDGWIMRAYSDGTMLFRRDRLYDLRYPTKRTIDSIVDYFYIKEGEYQDGAQGYYRVFVYRRKPLNPYHVTPTAPHFGRFLEHKYNRGETNG